MPSVKNKPFMVNVVMLNVVMLNVIMLNVIMLNVVMLNFVMLDVVMLIAVMLNVATPFGQYLLVSDFMANLLFITYSHKLIKLQP
jgi:hypothetical protein